MSLNIPLFHKVYDLYKIIDSYHSRIPRHQRYTLWLRCENNSLSLLEGVIAICHAKGENRLGLLQEISQKLDLQKVLIRLAKETRLIDSKQYLEIQTILQEAGRMIGGWIKAAPR